MGHIGACLRLRVGKFDEELALRDVLSFVDQNLRDHATFEMLNGLAVGFERDHTASHNGISSRANADQPPSTPKVKIITAYPNMAGYFQSRTDVCESHDAF